MKETLIIYLHSAQLERPSWIAVDDQGEPGEYGDHDSTEGLSGLAQGRKVVVIVPGEAVVLTSVVLPSMSRARLLQALPYALEEQMIEEVESLHFAIGERQADGSLPVAIVDKATIQGWLAMLHSWGIKPDVLLPAMLALPATVAEWQLALADVALVRTGPYQGFACDPANVDDCLCLALSTTPQAPSQLTIYNCTKKKIAKKISAPLMIEEELISTRQFMENVARVINEPSINLRQGLYTRKKSAKAPKSSGMKLIFNLSLALLALLFLYPMGSYIILKRQVDANDKEIKLLYQKQFPGTKKISAPRVRMEDKLQKLRAQVGDNPVLLQLGYIGKAVQDVQGIGLEQMDYQNSRLTLMLTASNSDNFSAFTDVLISQGLQVKQQNASLSGDRVTASLQID